MKDLAIRSLHALISASMVLAVPACDDPDGDDTFDDLGDIEERADAASTFFTCKSAARDLKTGTDWYYETQGVFNNTSPSVDLMVSWNGKQGASGLASPLTLPKIGTDTFSDDQKVTVRLQQKKDGKKGIRVDHHTIGLTADVENSYCTTTLLKQSTHTRHDFFYGAKSVVSGPWRIFKIDEQLVDADGQEAELSFDVPFNSDPNYVPTGSLSYLQACDVMAQAGYYGTYKDDVGSGAFLPALVGLIHLALGTAGALNCLQNGGHVVQSTMIRPYLGTQVGKWLPLGMDDLKQACGTGSDTLYFNQYTGLGPYQAFSSAGCIQMYDPVDSNKNQPYMYLRVKNTDLHSLSKRATLIKQ